MAKIKERDLGSNRNGFDGGAVHGSPQDHGNYITFDGYVDFISFGPSHLNETSIDIFAKVRFDDLSKGSAQCIWKSGDGSNGIAIGVDSMNRVGVFARLNGVLSSITLANSLQERVWYEVYATRGRIAVYHNGNLIENATGSLSAGSGGGEESLSGTSDSSPISQNPGEFFSGCVDTVQVWEGSSLTFPEGDGLIAAYRMNEVSTGILKDSAGVYDLELRGTPTLEEGRDGPCVVFDGEEDYATLPTFPQLTNVMSVSFFVKFKKMYGNGAPRSLAVLTFNAPNTGIGVGTSMYAGNRIFPYVSAPLSIGGVKVLDQDPEKGFRYSIDRWYHVLVQRTAEDDGCELYIDGELKETFGDAEASTPVNAGHNGFTLAFANGIHTNCALDELRVYSRRLDELEILALSEVGGGPPAVGHGKFRAIRINEKGRFEEYTLETATTESDGIMSADDKAKLEFVAENLGINVGDVEGLLTPEQIRTLKFSVGKGFEIDLSEFNEARVSLADFLRRISTPKGDVTPDEFGTLAISGGDGIDVEVSEESNLLIINRIDRIFQYQSDSPSVLHEVDHDLDSYNLMYHVLVEDAVTGHWSNDIVKVNFVNPNKAEVWLTESSNIMLLLKKL
jgi:hypothetical protein